jgi:hypothetical protein
MITDSGFTLDRLVDLDIVIWDLFRIGIQFIFLKSIIGYTNQ